MRLESAYNGRMTVATLPLQLLLLTVSGWVHRHQQDVIAYLVEENRVLKEQLRGRKLRLTDDQRRRLAVKAKCLGRRALDAVATLVTPDTLMRWHRRLIAWKWTYAARRVGRPGVRKVIAALIVRLARENDRWGYGRIQGELRKLGHRVAASTIGKVLKDHGIRPAPDRPTSWRTFLRAHWGEVAGMDFFTTEVWTPLGLTTYYILFLIDLKTRRAHIAGLTTTPDGAFIAQVARNLTDPEDGFPSRAPVRDLRPRREVHHGVPAHPTGRRRAGHPDPEASPELQRSRGALCAVDQVRVFEPDDVLRRSVVASRCWRIPSALPPGATAPGARERDARFRSAVHRGGASVHRATRRPPQTLRARGVAMSVINRSAVIIRPLPPSLAWAKPDDTTNIAERVFEDLRTAPHVYLFAGI